MVTVATLKLALRMAKSRQSYVNTHYIATVRSCVCVPASISPIKRMKAAFGSCLQLVLARFAGWNNPLVSPISAENLVASPISKTKTCLANPGRVGVDQLLIQLNPAPPLLQGSAMDEEDSQDESINRNTSHSQGRRTLAWAISGTVSISHTLLVFFSTVTHQNKARAVALHLAPLVFYFVFVF